MQRHITRHKAKLWESHGSMRDRIEQARGIRGNTRGPSESTNLALWALMEAEPPTKEHEVVGPRILVYL